MDSFPIIFLNILGEEAVKEIKKSFILKGYVNESGVFVKWVNSYPSKLRTGLLNRNNSTLTDTGRLKNSIEYEISNDNKELRIGTNVPYAKDNNEGAEKPWSYTLNDVTIGAKRMFERKFLFFSPIARDIALGKINTYAKNKFKIK